MIDNCFPDIFKKEVVINEFNLVAVSLLGEDKQSITNALNTATKLYYQPLNLKLYVPELVATDLPVYNSLLRVKIVPDKRQIADYYLSYNRVHVSDLGAVRVLVGGHSFVSDVLDQINTQFNTNITNLDIENSALPDPDVDGKATIHLVFQPSSIRYYSGTRIKLKSEVVSIPNITKYSVGLGNVDNTTDTDKPVSTAQAVADTAVLIAAKAYADAIVPTNPGGSGDPIWATVGW